MPNWVQSAHIPDTLWHLNFLNKFEIFHLTAMPTASPSVTDPNCSLILFRSPPQELAVYEDFTIEETLIYFGRLFRLSKQKLEERIEFLLAFLDLPHKNRLVQNLR